MPLTSPSWFYQDPDAPRNVDVEVDVSAFAALTQVTGRGSGPTAILAAHQPAIEQAARRIIDREGPNFAEPVRVTVSDL